MFNTNIKKISDKGCISLVVKKDARGTMFFGDKIEDQSALVTIIHRLSFSKEEFDTVLAKVEKEWHVGLEVIGECPE